MKKKPTKDSTAWCPKCGDELRVVQEQLKPNEHWLYQCNSCEDFFELRPATISKEVQEEFIWQLRDSSFHGVIALEAVDTTNPSIVDDEYDDVAEAVDDYEFSDVETKRFEAKLKELRAKGELGHTQYIGNAYFVETTTEELLNELFKILKEDAKHIPTGSEITLDLGYWPEWASDEDD